MVHHETPWLTSYVETLEHRVQALETERTAAHCTIHWQFTSRDARTKLADLYPVIQTKVD